MMSRKTCDVLVVGAGVSGMSAGLYTARAGLETIIVNTGTSILNRNAHLENYPGFPRGIDPRLLIEMIRDQVEYYGSELLKEGVTSIEGRDPFEIDLQEIACSAHNIIIASWSDLSYLKDIELKTYEKSGKTFLWTNKNGMTSVDGIYAAGRIAGTHHQSIVSAGDGARVALNLLKNINSDFYHDWTAPEGYFTGRDRQIPEGCEEITEQERRNRDRQGREALMDYLKNPMDNSPEKHPSQQENSDEEN